MQAAMQMQRAVTAREAERPANQRIAFRMGLNIADIIVEDHDIYGDGVNIAARLQSHAEAGGIVISGLVAEHVGGTLGMQAVDLGQIFMRNRSQPVRVLSLKIPRRSSPHRRRGRAWLRGASLDRGTALPQAGKPR